VIATLHRLDAVRLAADYSAAVRAELTEGQLINVRNGDNVAADYVDTGELMVEALEQQVSFDSITEYADEMIAADQRATDSGYRLHSVLIACEYSATVRDAFAARGHHAVSCDVKETDNPAGHHYRGDVRDILTAGWSMMIAHPPCTYIAACQLWRCLPKHAAKHPGRAEKQAEALEFVRDLGRAPIAQVCVENPKSCIGTAGVLPGYDPQLIQPYQFGHNHSKETYLWRRELPELVADPADYIEPSKVMYNGKMRNRWANQSPCGADNRGPSADRGHLRSKFFSGFAEAMANQWGGITGALTTPATVRPIGQLALF
jgi:hypothetical protein